MDFTLVLKLDNLTDLLFLQNYIKAKVLDLQNSVSLDVINSVKKNLEEKKEVKKSLDDAAVKLSKNVGSYEPMNTVDRAKLAANKRWDKERLKNILTPKPVQVKKKR